MHFIARLWRDGRLVRWLLYLLLWTAIGLFYATRSGFPGQNLTWSRSLQTSIIQWYIWGLLAPLIVKMNHRLIGRRDVVIRLLLNIPFCVLFTVSYIYINDVATAFLNHQMGAYKLSADTLAFAYRGTFHWDALVYWTIVGFCIAFDYQHQVRRREVRAVALERSLSEARLANLRTQLHPHFLFNALNAVSSEVERDGRAARRMIEELAILLRASLDHSEDQEVALSVEIALLEHYLNLQRVRFEDRLNVSVRIEPDLVDALVPVFLLQPIVENAIRHGVEKQSDMGFIEIVASREGERLRMVIRDDGPGLSAGWQASQHAGIGISNTCERLNHLYGADQSFEIMNRPEVGVQVNISIPLHLKSEFGKDEFELHIPGSSEHYSHAGY